MGRRKRRLWCFWSAQLVVGARGLGGAVGSTGKWSRVVAVGDLHGDSNAMRTCLRLAGVVNCDGSWRSEGTLVVCCGDVLDKGGEDWSCLQYLSRLRREARALDTGDVAMILGNHEVMNLEGRMRHVSRQGFRDVAGDCPLETARRVRREHFAPGGRGAKTLAELCCGAPVARIVGDTLFAHGGLHADFLDKHRRPGEKYRRVLRRLNAEACDWLAGRLEAAPPGLAESDDSPAWLTAYSNPPDADPDPEHCRVAHDALAKLGCRRMVVGHTPQLLGCNAACAGAVIRIDTGASRVYGGPREALELRPGHPPRVVSSAIRFGL